MRDHRGHEAGQDAEGTTDEEEGGRSGEDRDGESVSSEQVVTLRGAGAAWPVVSRSFSRGRDQGG
jgi:hypothetical protein